MTINKPQKIQRIVGAVFLGALSLLVLTLIFAPSKDDDSAHPTQGGQPVSIVSNNPNDQTQYWHNNAEESFLQQHQQNQSAQNAPQKAPSNQTGTSEPPALDLISSSKPTQNSTNQQTTPNESWFVQVGVFGNEVNARNLHNKLADAGYKVYIQKDGNLSKVRVGPFMQRENAINVQNRLKQQGQETSLIHIR